MKKKGKGHHIGHYFQKSANTKKNSMNIAQNAKALFSKS